MDTSQAKSQTAAETAAKKLRTFDLKQFENKQAESFGSNTVKTAKYTWYNFVPKNLIAQFRKIANFYFLIITFMQMVPQISISEGEPVMAVPLVAVVAISMLKDGYEDFMRHQDDKKENNTEAIVVDKSSGQERIVKWHEVRVGDFVKVKEDTFFPADMVIVSTSTEDGLFFVETKSLDGETNLKTRNIQDDLGRLKIGKGKGKEISAFKPSVEVEAPNANMHKFNGAITFDLVSEETDQKKSLSLKNIALRGMSLRNTEWIVGLVVYSGADTKIQKNLQDSTYKISNLLHKTNKAIIWIFVAQLTVAILVGVYGASNAQNNLEVSYLAVDTEDEWSTDWNKLFISLSGTWVLLMTNVVPVSLLVTLELVHFFQGYFMQNDYDMYDEKQKYFMKCNTTNINEELGQVEYIFSDKTGTLTCNIMEFMKFSSRENAYYAKSEHTASDQTTSKQPKESGSSAQNKTAINSDAQEAHEFQNQGSDDLIYFEKTKQMIMDQKSEESHELYNTLLHISLCHSVVIDERKKNKLPDVKKSLDEKVEKAKKGSDKGFLKKMEALRAEKLDELEKGVYNSASPDEIALILGAKLYGFEFTGLDGDNVLHVMDPLGKEQKFKLLNTLEFNSARKRMSVIIENVETQEIKLLTKGADSVVEPFISQDSSDEKKKVENVYKIINKNAAEGLRTLVLTEKVLSKSEWEDFNRRFNDAQNLVEGREEKVDEVAASIERNLTIVGSTAIEDLLQEDVADTIVSLRKAGIKIWVLTGDKVGTAMNVGVTCGLLDSTMKEFVIREGSKKDIKETLGQHFRESKMINKSQSGGANKQKMAVIVAGEALTVIQQSTTMLQKFLDLTSQSDVCLCCRVSPKQKAEVVEMVKKQYPEKISLSIGDGANDVPMLMMAHIGIGIAGREGMQAARAADYAFGQFKSLKNLLFYHGREAYRRNSDTVSYSFYKNLLYVLAQMIYNLWAQASGQVLYEPWIYQLYNFSYTGPAIMWWAVFDYEFSREEFYNNPHHYKLGMEGRQFNGSKTLGWNLFAFYQACLTIAFGMYATQVADEYGQDYGMWAGGHVVYGHCILIANLVLLQMKHNWTGYGAAMMFLQWLFYYFSLYLDTVMFDTNVIYAFYNQWCYNWYAWMGNFAVVVVVLVLEPSFVKLPDLLRRSLARCKKGGDNGYTKIDPYGIQDQLDDKTRNCFGKRRVTQQEP